MPNKKNSKSALYFFAKERIEQNRADPIINVAINDVFPEWKAMSLVERAPYERKYKEWKEEKRREKELVTPIIKTEYVSEFHENKDTFGLVKDELIKHFDRNLVNLKKTNSSLTLMDVAKKQRWYFMKFQTFCKSDVNPYETERRKYNPYFVLAEVGIVEYSLLEGIVKEYHAFIKPNKIPLGYRSQCMDSFKDVHQIPIDNFDQCRKSYAEIYEDIVKFINPKEENNYYAPVFCLSKDIEETKFGLQFLKDEGSVNLNLNQTVYDLECLVVTLAHTSNNEISYIAARDILTSYSFDYSANSRCPFHEDLGTINCALGYAKRAAYHISDQLCPSYEVKVTEKHLPVEKPTGTLVHNDTYRTKGLQYKSYSKNSINNYREFKNEEPYSKRFYDNTDDDSKVEGFISNQSGSRTSLLSNDNNRVHMPSVDIRYNSTSQNSLIQTQNQNQTQNRAQVQTPNRIGTNRRLMVADKFESSLLSDQSNNRNHNDDYDNNSHKMNDDEEGWTVVDKTNRALSRDQTFDNQSVVSEKSESGVASITGRSTNSEVTTKTSSTNKYMGRGRLLNK